MLLSLPFSAFFGMHFTAKSFPVAFSSAKTTSEKAPLWTEREKKKGYGERFWLQNGPSDLSKHDCYMVSSRTPSQMPLGEESHVDNCISVQRDGRCQHRNKGAVKAAVGGPLWSASCYPAILHG